MGQVIQVNGDYNIKARQGSRIILDPGETGDVVITGNLVVEGESVEVSTEDLVVKDNIITLNDGDPGPGVTLNLSGVEINRGEDTNNVGFFWNEQLGSWTLVSGSETDDFSVDGTSRVTLKEILTDSSIDDGDLTLIGSGIGVIKVTGTNNYEDQISDDDDIPNKKYVDDAILRRPDYRIGVGTPPPNPDRDQFLQNDNTIVLTSDSLLQNSVDDYENLTGETFTESAVSIIVNSIQPPTAQFFQDSIRLQDIEIFDNEISNTNAGGEVFVKTSGNGKLRTNNSIRIEYSNQPGSILNSSLLYAATPSLGTTGLYFVNPNSVTEPQNKTGELISKNRALVYSMIF